MIFVMRRFTFLVFIIIWSSLYVLLLLLCLYTSLPCSVQLVNFHHSMIQSLSKRSVISHDYKTMHLFFFLCYYQIFCEVQFRCATEKNPPEEKKINTRFDMRKIYQQYKTFHSNFGTEYTNDKGWFITRPRKLQIFYHEEYL